MIQTVIFVLLTGIAGGGVYAAPQSPPNAVAVPGNIAAQRSQADQLYDQGKADEAKIIYARIASLYAKDFEFNMRLAHCFFISKSNEMAKAAVYYGKAHALKPKNVEAELNWAKTLSWSKQYAKAVSAFRSIVERDVDNRAAWLELARARNYEGDAKGARATYETYLKRWPTDRDVRLEYAQWLSWNKQYDEAVANYDMVRKQEPNNATLIASQAQVLAWEGDLQRALELYDQALARSPKLYDALRGKAFTLLWLERYEDAARLFAQANQQKKPDSEVTQAMQAITRWRNTEPERRRNAELNVFLLPADAAMARKDFPSAIELFRKALALAPQSEDIRFRLGEACLWDRRWDAAIEIFAGLNAQHPQDVKFVRELGYAYNGAKRLAESAKLYREFLQQTPDLNIRLDLARVLSWAGQLDESAAEFRSILREQPDNFDAALGLAQLTAWQGRSAEALTEFDRLIERNPQSREAKLGRAQVLSWTGRSTEAIAELTALLQTYPQDPEIAGILQSVQDSVRRRGAQQRLASGKEGLEERIRRDEASLKDTPADVVLLQRLGDGYAELARYKEAITDYEEALALHPTDNVLALRLARVTNWNRNFTRSIELYRQLLVREDKPEYRQELAQVLSWAGRNRESIAEYRRLLERSPDDVPVRLGLARVLSWDKQTDEALAEYERVLAKEPHNQNALFERARTYAWKGDYATALKMYAALLVSAPADRQVLLAKAQVLNWSGAPRDAKKILDEIGKENPSDRDTTLTNAAVQSSLGRRDISLRLLDDLDKLQPGNHDVESMRRSIRDELRPMLVLNFTPSFDSGDTNIFASTATVYFSPRPQIRSYLAATFIPSFTPAFGSETGREFLFGSYGHVNNWLQMRGEIGASAASSGTVSPIGSAGATVFINDKMQADFDFSRRFVNYLPQPVTLDISRLQYRAAWNWRIAQGTTFHIDYLHESYSDTNRNNAANISVMQNLLRKEHFELEGGYLFARSGFDHVGTSGFFTPTSFQRHAALGNARIKFSERSGVSFWGSLGSESVFDDPFRLDGTSRASWDYKLTPNLKMSTGYGYFAVSSVGGSAAYVTHTVYSLLQYTF